MAKRARPTFFLDQGNFLVQTGWDDDYASNKVARREGARLYVNVTVDDASTFHLTPRDALKLASALMNAALEIIDEHTESEKETAR